MKKLLIMFFVLISPFIAESQIAQATVPPSLFVETIPKPEGNWVYIPEGSGKMVINIITRNVNKVTVWIVPTGTQTWEERRLLCEVSGDKDFWTCIWHYTAEETIHNHIVVGVKGEGGESKTSINVTRRHSEDHPQ